MIQIVERIPTVREYQSIIASVGFRDHTVGAIETALKNTVFCVCAIDGDNVVGFGRIVGDGSISFLLTNVIVRPEYQRQRIGTRIVEMLCEMMDSLPHKNMVLEVAPLPELETFYKLGGFTSCRLAPPGMVRWFNKTESESGRPTV